MNDAEHLSRQLTDTSVGAGTHLIVGDAGMGKTHILHDLAGRVRAAGGRVGWTQCNQALGGPPLWEWRSATAELDASISHTFPGHDGLEVFQNTWQWLEASGATQPTLLVLDDLHDASSATVDLFEQLEIDAIESELLAAFGLGGRSRRMGDEAEQARVNVRRNLNRAIAAVEAVAPAIGDHLRHRIVTGRFCSYRPGFADSFTWSILPESR